MTQRSSNHDLGWHFATLFFRKVAMNLSKEEIDLLKVLIQGKTNIEIADIFGYSESSIKKKLTKIYKKFDAINRLALINKLLSEHKSYLFD